MAETVNTIQAMPPHLVDALEREELSIDELRELIGWEAARIGLTFDEALERARDSALPRDAHGSTLEFHIKMLSSQG